MPRDVCNSLASTANSLTEKRELLAMVNDAIRNLILGGVQSYTIGKRSLTRINLADLRALKSQLEVEIAATETPSHLMTGTHVAYFNRR